MKSITQKGIIPARTLSQDKKFQTSRPCAGTKVRSGQVRSGHNICCLCGFLLGLSNCRVTYENCYKLSVFFQSSLEWMDLRNSNGFELKNSYFTTVWKLFSKIFIRSGKMHHVELNSVTSKSSK